MVPPIMNLEPNQLLLSYVYWGWLRCCQFKSLDSWPLSFDYRYREIYRNRDQAENIEDGAEPTHVSLDVLSAVVVDPCRQLVREDIDGC